MYNVTLACTRHYEYGKCNSEELYNIIEKINPEIIFEEIPYHKFIEQHGASSNNILEIKAIKKYLKNHQIEQVHVDDSDLLKYQDKFEYRNHPIICKNHLLNNLVDELGRLEYHYGFAYMNTDSCDELFEKIRIQEKFIIERSAIEELSNLYHSWHEIQEKRDYKMISNIYEYSSTYQYDKAIFLVGAGHRKSIINKIEEKIKNGNIKLNWTINLI